MIQIAVGGASDTKTSLHEQEKSEENRAFTMNAQRSVAFSLAGVYICRSARTTSIRCTQLCDRQAAAHP